VTPQKPLIGITVGDPAGIGPEVVAKAAANPDVCARARLLAIGPIASIQPTASKLGLAIRRVEPGHWDTRDSEYLPVLDIPGDVSAVQVGQVSAEAGRIALAALTTAVQLALDGQIDAITTAPWNKEAIALTHEGSLGHTEMLAELTGTNVSDVTMMIAYRNLRVFHVSTHIPLRAVFDAVKVDRIVRVIRLANQILRRVGLEAPRVAVAGLNPHAGEGGHLGTEDASIIRPAVLSARNEGIDVTGPLPADTVFVRALRGHFDGVVAMYHDQGHVAVKVAGMGHGVNVTVGLPIIRTSVDHGTAFDIAGQDLAEPTSMIEAINFAVDLVMGRDARQPLNTNGSTARIGVGRD